MPCWARDVAYGKGVGEEEPRSQQCPRVAEDEAAVGDQRKLDAGQVMRKVEGQHRPRQHGRGCADTLRQPPRRTRNLPRHRRLPVVAQRLSNHSAAASRGSRCESWYY